MAVVNVRGQTYHMDDKLKEKWDSIKDGKLAHFDEDRFYIVDGGEGSGKSLFTLQNAAYIDETILDDVDDESLPRICFTSSEFLKAIRHTKSTKKHTKVVIFDEAFRGMSSKGALSKNNKEIVQALMEARQNNLVVFIVSPSFYLLEFYPAVLRSKALFHVVKEKGTRRRYVRIFGYKKKAYLYQIGVRKAWGYPVATKRRVRFFNLYPGGIDFETRYREKKRLSLVDSETKVERQHKWEGQRNALIRILVSQGLTQKEVAERLTSAGYPVTKSLIGLICKDIGTDGKSA